MAEPTLLLDEFLPYRLSFTANLVSDALAGLYRATFGLAVPEWRVIAVAAEHDGISQQAIVLRTRMDKVTVSRAAAALVARGLLARTADLADRRSHRLVLTEAGRALHAGIAPRALALERRVVAALDPGERDAFVATLRRIDAALLDPHG